MFCCWCATCDVPYIFVCIFFRALLRPVVYGIIYPSALLRVRFPSLLFVLLHARGRSFLGRLPPRPHIYVCVGVLCFCRVVCDFACAKGCMCKSANLTKTQVGCCWFPRQRLFFFFVFYVLLALGRKWYAIRLLAENTYWWMISHGFVSLGFKIWDRVLGCHRDQWWHNPHLFHNQGETKHGKIPAVRTDASTHIRCLHTVVEFETGLAVPILVRGSLHNIYMCLLHRRV